MQRWRCAPNSARRADATVFLRAPRDLRAKSVLHGSGFEGLLPVMQNLELRRVADFFHQREAVFERREEGVALDLAFDEREEEVGKERQRLRVDFRAAADIEVERRVRRAEFQKALDQPQVSGLRAAELRKLELERPGNLELAAADARLAEELREIAAPNSRMTGEDDVDAIGQRLAEALEGF